MLLDRLSAVECFEEGVSLPTPSLLAVADAKDFAKKVRRHPLPLWVRVGPGGPRWLRLD